MIYLERAMLVLHTLSIMGMVYYAGVSLVLGYASSFKRKYIDDKTVDCIVRLAICASAAFISGPVQ